jgi:GH18 family chitinase
VFHFQVTPGFFLIYRYVDEINLMTYDMHGGSWEDKTAPNAPLKAHPSETGNQTTLNVVSYVNYYDILMH